MRFDTSMVRAAGMDVALHSLTGASVGLPPIVGIHGFGVSGIRTFRYVARQFMELGVDLHAPDLPGFGQSPAPQATPSLHLYAAVTAEILRRLDTPRPYLLGHSMGGKVAAATAVLYPSLVEGLILVNSGGFSIYAPWLPRVAGLRVTNALLGKDRFSARAIAASPLKNFVTTRANRNELLMLRDSHFELDLKHAGLWERLGEIEVPVHAIWGDDDPILPGSTIGRIQRQIPTASVSIIRDAGHAPMKDQPDEFVAAVMSFLRRSAELTERKNQLP